MLYCTTVYWRLINGKRLFKRIKRSFNTFRLQNRNDQLPSQMLFNPEISRKIAKF